jgi:hypothetical protein
VIVVSTDHVAQWGNIEGTMVHEALREGRTLVGA